VSENFKSTGLPISRAGFGAVAEKLRVFAADIWAVLTVETRGSGFLTDRRPLILFERHVFRRHTKGRHDATHPDLSNARPGGYGPGGAQQYERLGRALVLDRTAALKSASWGIGQVMGGNFAMAGYADVETMVDAMVNDEDAQLDAMAGFIDSAGLGPALRAHDWPSFARGYNGRDYAKNHYDTRLAAAHERFSRGQLPDLATRRAQVLLGYLGYQPGPVDGVLGRFTRAALEDFQADEKLDPSGELDAETSERLDERALG